MKTTQQIKSVMTDKLAGLSVTELKTVVSNLYAMDSKDVDVILPMALNALEMKMQSSDFCAFLETV